MPAPERVAQFRTLPAYRETRNYVRRVTDKFNKTFKSSSRFRLYNKIGI